MIIDRFEGEFAVVEDGEKLLRISKTLFPETAKEGDVIIKDGETYRVDFEKTAERRQEVLAKLRKLGL